MADDRPTRIDAVPVALSQLMVMNDEHKVLICLGHGCRCAVRPTGFLRHVRDQKHPITKASRRRVGEYIQAFPYDYSYSTIAFPANGLAPQPVIPVVDGFLYQKCLDYYSTSRKKMKVYRNKEHLLKGIADDELFQLVRMQLWFGEGKERY